MRPRRSSVWCYDAEETLMEVCRDARATRGWWGLAHTAFADIADIARASVVLVLVLLLTFAAMTS